MPSRYTDVLWDNDSSDLVKREASQYVIIGGGGGAPAAHATSHQNGGSDEINVAGLSGQLADSQLLSVRVDSSAPTYTRTRLNLIAGTNITLTMGDDAGNDEVDVTIDASGGGGGGFTKGDATLDFGATPGSGSTSVNVTTGIGAGDMAWVSVMYESSADHNAEEHALLARHLGLTAYRSALNTLTIEARSDLRITGAVKVRWGWSA